MSKGKGRYKINHQKQVKQPKELLNIIIPVYGRFDLLEKCISSIKNSQVNFEYKVIIHDNASPDQDEANQFYNRLNGLPLFLNKSKHNLGFPRGCNIAAKRGTAPLIFFLNSDVILEPDALQLLVDTMNDKNIGVAGMKLIFPLEVQDPIRPPGRVQHVGLFTNVRGEWMHTFIGWTPDNPKVNRIRDVHAVTGAALITRRELWNRIGGFYEGYGAGTFEDIDYCMATRDLGYNIVVETKAVGYHYTNATAIAYGIPYPMNQNKAIFMARWGNKLAFSEWMVL